MFSLRKVGGAGVSQCTAQSCRAATAGTLGGQMA